MTNPTDPARIQDRPLQLEPLLAWGLHPQCGGLALFAGTVRDHHDGKQVLRLTYTAYAPLAEKQIRDIEQAVAAKHGVPYLRVLHRVGGLAIGEVAIYCVARAPHRAEAFAACEEAVDRVKHEVPIWKEEFYADGTSAFVEGCCIRPDLDGATPAQPHHHEEQRHARRRA
ncbi:molybdenum cofactor biosynthesis protein MoaE [Solimonas soli]|uniref:molybdenum cofactor biosynthesis protein MoaE n=1 Tax=Solimonas soli TaxID=413479 RepID=UPI000487CB81|nr:molybdenum cofactor biosynthesis protein MoaE [Solimonas soli]